MEIGDPERPTPRDVASLRAVGPADLVPLALELAAARRRAAGRFDAAAVLWCDRPALEQASGTAAARHKAVRFASLRAQRVLDLCCGMGGDAIELSATAGCEVLAVDADEARCAMAALNAPDIAVRVGDVAALEPDGTAFHLDPARRDRGGRRRWRLDEFSPGLPVVDRWVRSGAPGAVKLGPGADLGGLPWSDRTEVEVLGDRRGLRQAIVWCGAMARAPGRRTASRVDLGVSTTGSPDVLPPGRMAPDAFVIVPDAALERAELVAGLAAEQVLEPFGHGLGLLTAAEPVRGPWFESFAVLAELPLRTRALRAWLAAHDAGTVEVKSRGGAADANALQRELHGSGAVGYVVFALRHGERRFALVTTRAATSA